MARSVSLSDEAFAILRREKRTNESDSDVVIRLQREARRKEKDPMLFFRRAPHLEITPEQFEEFREKMRAADIAKAKRLYDAGA